MRQTLRSPARDPLHQARTVIVEALARGPACLTCSFQAEDVAVLHLLRRQAPHIPVLFLDTGYHFPEVLALRDHLAGAWRLDLRNVAPAESVTGQESRLGLLYQHDAARCCHLRKVEPLMAALAGFDLWFTGLRREQSPSRAHLEPVEQHAFPNGLRREKVSPLYDWSSAEVFAYLEVNEIPVLPLYAQGYPSIGCLPCTERPAADAHPRSGRWGGHKLECGLHTASVRDE